MTGLKVERVSPGRPVTEKHPMKTSPPKITLSRSQDIPFNKLILSQANVRQIKAGISVEDLAEDIARRGLLQGLSVRAVRDTDGTETGMYEIPAGGRRYRALELLVKQKRMAKTQAVPCVVRTEGLAEEDLLAENVQRVALHPLDQFRAFQTLRDQGLGEEDIAARFFVSPAVVKQRLKLAAVSPRLLDLYAEDEMTLEQLMAFTVTDDHARQEQVWDSLARVLQQGALVTSAASSPRARSAPPTSGRSLSGSMPIRRPAASSRAICSRTTMAAGCRTRRCSTGSSPRSSRARPRRCAAKAGNGSTPLPISRSAMLPACAVLAGETPPLTEDEQASCDALRAEFDALQETYAGADELPDEVDTRLGEIETLLEAFDERPALYDPAAMANAGVFLSIDADGDLRDRARLRPSRRRGRLRYRA